MSTDTTLSPDRRLWQALHDGDLEAAGQALADGADVNSRSASGISIFLHFASEGRMPQAQFLKQKGANVNAVDRMRQNALHRLVVSGRHQHITDLMALGVDQNAYTASGAPALLLAVVQRNPGPMVRAMLDAGADPNVRAESGATPLLAAVSAGHYDLALDLVRAGADATAVDRLGQGVLHSLPPDAPVDFVRQLLALAPEINVDLPAKSGTTPLGQAANYGAADLITLLLEHGANPNTRSANQFGSRPTALMILAASEADPSLPAMRSALKAGADVFLRDNNGCNAAWYALHGRRPVMVPAGVPEEMAAQLAEQQRTTMASAVIDLLLEAGLDPQQPLGRDAATPYLLGPKGEAGVPWVHEMHRRGFPVNPEAYQGELSQGKRYPTPLGAALAHQELAIARALLEIGADPTLPAHLTPNDETPMHLLGVLFSSAKEEQAAHAIRSSLTGKSGDKVEEHNKKVQAQLEAARAKSSQQATQMLSELAQKAGRIDVVDGSGRTPLMTFIAQGRMDLAQHALGLGADPFLRDEQGLDALGVALQVGNIEGAHALLSHFKSTGQIDRAASCLLDAAYASPDRGQERHGFFQALHSLAEEPSLIQWLSASDEEGLTPLIVAAATAQEDLVDLFLSMGADPNIADAAGNTALHHGIAQQKSDITRALRAAGGQMEVPNSEGVTPLEVAGALGKAYMVKAATEQVEPNHAKWPMPDEVRQLRDAGRSAWAGLTVRGLPSTPGARTRMGM